LCNKNCNVTVIYGHNENLFTTLKKLKEKYPNINTIDYTPDMDKLLEDSDFIVTKPGGLICYESIVTRTPMLLFNLNHGEARGDMEYMVDNGCAIVLNNEGIVDFTIKNILDRNKEVIRDMSLNMIKLDFTKQMQNFILNDSALKFSYSGAFVSK
jgi:processive 1,2-diacylglycerol beta-glucosyltransferase